jgi:DNA-directed RNA polymerase specialized sigma24 family protein
LERLAELDLSAAKVLVLSALEGLSIREIARDLNVQPATVARRRQQAVALLRALLEEVLPEIEDEGSEDVLEFLKRGFVGDRR